MQKPLSLLVVGVGLLAVALIGPGSAGTVGVSAAPAPEVVRHEVRKGDTLYDIARAHGVTVDGIKKANGLTRDTIYPGQTLTIPAAYELYRVKAGDCLWTIAARFGTTIAGLAKANHLINPNRLVVGALLRVPVTPAAGQGVRPASGAASERPRFSWPIRGAITSPYGLRRGEMHEGIDIAASYGDSIRAAAEGVVQSVGWISGYGLAVVIRHAAGYRTLYAHTQKVLVKVGAQVEQGQIIATVGSTGHSTGPHLHFEVRLNGRTMDPLIVLPP